MLDDIYLEKLKRQFEALVAGDSNTLSLRTGVNTVFDINHPYRFVIETAGGTIVKGRATQAAPLEINPASDIVSCKIIIESENTTGLHLVPKNAGDQDKIDG